MIPFQGGTNEQVIHNMYIELNKEDKQDNLKVYWYTAKDQNEPMSAAKKARNCHGEQRLSLNCNVFLRNAVSFSCLQGTLLTNIPDFSILCLSDATLREKYVDNGNNDGT